LPSRHFRRLQVRGTASATEAYLGDIVSRGAISFTSLCLRFHCSRPLLYVPPVRDEAFDGRRRRRPVCRLHPRRPLATLQHNFFIWEYEPAPRDYAGVNTLRRGMGGRGRARSGRGMIPRAATAPAASRYSRRSGLLTCRAPQRCPYLQGPDKCKRHSDDCKYGAHDEHIGDVIWFVGSQYQLINHWFPSSTLNDHMVRTSHLTMI
jgi:hypothetical protein